MSSITDVLAGLRATSAWEERVYKDLHAHPELSFQETRMRGELQMSDSSSSIAVSITAPPSGSFIVVAGGRFGRVTPTLGRRCHLD